MIDLTETAKTLSDSELLARLNWVKQPCGECGLEALAKIVIGPMIIQIAKERGLKYGMD